MLSMGFPFYVFVMAVPCLFVAVVISCCVAKKSPNAEIEEDDLEGGEL
jgi:hypothetical protein